MFVGFMRHRLKGAGHFVKMVHNGIEYAVMHLLAELHGFRRFAEDRLHGFLSRVLTFNPIVWTSNMIAAMQQGKGSKEA